MTPGGGEKFAGINIKYRRPSNIFMRANKGYFNCSQVPTVALPKQKTA